MPERAPLTIGDQISFGVEALVRATVPPFGDGAFLSERSLARARLGGEIASQILGGADPGAILQDLVAAIERVRTTRVRT